MKLLALDTSTEACSAALHYDGELIEQYKLAPRQHAALILPMLDQLMGEAQITLTQLDAIAFGRGPGAFVGVRIAAAVTQGIAFAADLPVVPISTLATLAQGSDQDHVLAAIDARMGEVYWGAYRKESGLVRPACDEAVTAPQQVSIPVTVNEKWFGVGSGWASYGEILNKNIQTVCGWQGEKYPRAASVAKLAVSEFLEDCSRDATFDVTKTLPTYLRNQVARSRDK